MLHIIKHYHSLLEAISTAVEGDVILLVEDGVYAAVKGHKANPELLSTSVPIYSLLPDVEARGLLLDNHTTSVDFAGFVTLTEKHISSITWE